MPPRSNIELLLEDAGECGLGRVSAAIRVREGGGTERRELDCYALVYLTRGGGRFQHALGASQPLRPGDAFLLFPGVTHSYGPGPEEQWSELYLLFEGPVFALWQQQGLLDPARPLYRLEPQAVWKPRVLGVWKEAGSTLERVLKMQHLLAAMNRARDEHGVGPAHLRWLQEARDLLHISSAQPGGAEAAARAMGMSYQTFRKTFSRLQGCGPGRYRTEQLMQTAARHLLTESTPIKQIAEDLGFCDEFHFSRRFKQWHGIAPGAYRRRLVAKE